MIVSPRIRETPMFIVTPTDKDGQMYLVSPSGRDKSFPVISPLARDGQVPLISPNNIKIVSPIGMFNQRMNIFKKGLYAQDETP